MQVRKNYGKAHKYTKLQVNKYSDYFLSKIKRRSSKKLIYPWPQKLCLQARQKYIIT